MAGVAAYMGDKFLYLPLSATPMARRRGTTKATRMKPEDTHRFLRFVLTHTGSDEDFHYIDIAKQMSAINRRLYRQGGTYHIANITVHDSNGDAYVKFAGLPTTWTAKAAWQRGFELWKKQRALAQSGGTNVSGKWSDFKVYLNNDHISDVDKPNFKDIENDVITHGEWDYSKMLLDKNGDDSDSFTLHMMGADNGAPSSGSCVSASLMKALQDVLNIPQDDPVAPGNADSSLFTLMASGGGDLEVNMDVVHQMEDDNDSPPYSSTLVAGAGTNCADPWEYREVSIKSSQSPSAMLPGFAVPLGLLCIETKSSTDDNEIGVLIELVPGPYKGVAFDSWA